jgi:hypothetical protein
LDEKPEIINNNKNVICKKVIDIPGDIIDKRDSNTDCADNIVYDNAITCSVCSKIYKNSATYTQHITYKRCNKFLIPRPIDNKCKYCERVFASKQSKERHVVTCRGNCIVSSVTVEQINKIVDNRIKSMK